MSGRQISLSILGFAICAAPLVHGISVAANDALQEVPITESERHHWAYLPMAHPQPPATETPHPIDAFLGVRLSEQNVEPLPEVGKATLLRRVYFDLTGLPPTPAELALFLDDRAADAYEKVVDRLLASPAYGERYAQHWLDLARYAETDGFEHDLVRPNAWRYRDWVIKAVNRDLPYDDFLRLQLAGDELRPGDPDAAIATGFLLCGPDMPDINLQQERRHFVLNEMTSTVGSVFLAMQFGCAQCHDHKYDPIRIQDFYRLRAFFEPAEIFRDHPIPSPEELAARQAAEAGRDPKYSKAVKRRDELEAQGRESFRQQNPDERPSLKQVLGQLDPTDRAEHAELVKLIKATPALPSLPQGRVMAPGKPREAYVYLRGDFRQQGPAVERAFPTVLASDADANIPPDRPRSVLAEWLTRDEHPLVARVIVNRLWQWHFGRGLVATPSDFGTMGAEPTHPELLDWLGRRFITDGWSFKQMHRLMVTSQAYRRASLPYDAEWSADQVAAAKNAWASAHASDPDNALFWRRPSGRLDGEALRDAMLVACQQLSSRSGGPGIRPPLAPEVTETLLKNQWQVSGEEEDHRRRSVYLFVRRNLRYPMFDVFDRPDTNDSCPMRHESTTATQSLTQFNSEFSLRSARWLAGAIWPAEQADVDLATKAAIGQAYLRVFNRAASDAELDAGAAFIERQILRLRSDGRKGESLALPRAGAAPDDTLRGAALVDFCLAMFNANEFLYVE